MVDRVTVDLGDVQKTMFLPLWGRATESKKRQPMLVDEVAVRIIEQVDFDFSAMGQKVDDLTRIAWIERSLFCDRAIKRFLARYPAGTVVNIGCGMDTTFERIDNGRLRWYDLDLPDVIALRSQFVQETERRTFIASSALDEEWPDAIEVNGNVLFVAAGFVYFFAEAVVRDLFMRLLDRFPSSEIVFDVASPLGVKISNRAVIESAGLDAQSHLIWGVESKDVFLSWDDRIRLIDTYHYYRIPGIGLRNRLMGLVVNLLNIQYMLHLGLGRPV